MNFLLIGKLGVAFAKGIHLVYNTCGGFSLGDQIYLVKLP